ncbi:hypothetical protein TNCV_557371 [Trichonephila clavipes]|uniref:Uncharacterized protein n=1 Tax=Trichonephila clavipes TaxID=2585209 RepID=A0A8X6V6Z8_TRICX|nr:hypothetical protein TNCV_557371 [Trichonephila clavipes]
MWLVKGEKMWEARNSNNDQGVLHQNRVKSSKIPLLKATVKLCFISPCYEEFSGPRSGTAYHVALAASMLPVSEIKSKCSRPFANQKRITTQISSLVQIDNGATTLNGLCLGVTRCIEVSSTTPRSTLDTSTIVKHWKEKLQNPLHFLT